MASQRFTLTRDDAGDDDNQDSATITVAAGQAIRVRFDDFPGALFGSIVPFLSIDRNSVETLHLIDTIDGWITEAVDEGDVVKVRLKFNGALATITGIVEEVVG